MEQPDKLFDFASGDFLSQSGDSKSKTFYLFIRFELSDKPVFATERNSFNLSDCSGIAIPRRGEEKKKDKGLFKQHVSNEVVEKILGNPDQIKLGGNLTVATILFSDIRGHTSIAEKMNPQKTVEMLNEYFSEMTEVIFKYRGTLNKFIRDGIMAVFGVPISEGSSADALKTVLAALEMQRQIEALNKRWDKVEGRSLLRIGMGIGTGEVLVGNIGFFARMEYTVIGDAVNVASRLEELTKEHQCGIIISEDTYEKVKNEIAVEPFRSTDIRGRSTRIEIYKVLGLKPSRLAGQEVMTHKK